MIAFPGRDDTTRGAGDTGADDGADDDAVSDGDVVAAGGVTTLVTTVAGGIGDTGAPTSATDDAEGVATVLPAGAAASTSEAAALVVFFARVVFGLASSSPVAAFLARLGLSTMGSPFKPFSSA